MHILIGGSRKIVIKNKNVLMVIETQSTHCYKIVEHSVAPSAEHGDVPAATLSGEYPALHHVF